MLINSDVSIGYCCSSCEYPQSIKLSMFDFSKNKGNSFNCSQCNTKSVNVVKQKKMYSIKVMCVDCGNEHAFLIKPHILWGGKPIQYQCPLSGNMIIALGEEAEIAEYVEQVKQCYMDEITGIADIAGLETGDGVISNLENIFKGINYLHELCNEGQVVCDCGCADMKITSQNFFIIIECKNCGKTREVFIGDLENPKYQL